MSQVRKKKLPKACAALFKETGERCWYCGVALLVEEVAVDHVNPQLFGGGGEGNLVPSCRSCNCAKGARGIERLRYHLTRKRDNAPTFSEEQIAWLAEQGFTFSQQIPFVFWFEELGLALPYEEGNC